MQQLWPNRQVLRQPITWLIAAGATVPVAAMIAGWMHPLNVLGAYWWEFNALLAGGLLQIAIVNRSSPGVWWRRGPAAFVVWLVSLVILLASAAAVPGVILLWLLSSAVETAGARQMPGQPDLDLWRDVLLSREALTLAGVLSATQAAIIARDLWRGTAFDSHREHHVYKGLILVCIPYFVFIYGAEAFLSLWPIGLVAGLILSKLWLELMVRSWYIGERQAYTEKADADHEGQDTRDREVV